eukprot:3627861-Rhodomonas_salina.1
MALFPRNRSWAESLSQGEVTILSLLQLHDVSSGERRKHSVTSGSISRRFTAWYVVIDSPVNTCTLPREIKLSSTSERS